MADALVAQLAGDAAERAAAVATLEATGDVALGVACVEALLIVLSKPVRDVDSTEYRQCCYALAHLASLHPVRFGGEWYRNKRFLLAQAKGNARDIGALQPDELSLEHALTLTALDSVGASMCTKGFTHPLHAAGTNMLEWWGTLLSQENQHAVLTCSAMSRILSLLLELLAERRVELSEIEVAGIWMWIFWNTNINPVLSLAAAKGGALGLGVAELQTGSPADWVSISRNPSGRFGVVHAAIAAICNYIPPLDKKRLILSTPKILDVSLDAIRAFEEANNLDDSNVTAVFVFFFGLYGAHPTFCEESERNRAAVRQAASSLRFALDNPLDWIKELGNSTSFMTVLLASAVFGRDEDNHATFLRQQDVDNVVLAFLSCLDGRLGQVPMQEQWSKSVLEISISDQHKLLLLRCSSLWAYATLCLFVDVDNHPRGPNATPPSQPIPEEMQAIWQRDAAEALLQLALFDAGRVAMREQVEVIHALEHVAKHGLTADAQSHAEGALMALADKEIPATNSGEQKHIMLSYQWDSQPTILRIHKSLCLRNYIVWIDTEYMKGSTMDAMSDAIERADVMLYGVSLAYKESANCRLEANYAHKQGLDMIPLKMQKDYSPRGWLGLMMGTRLYYPMWGAEEDDDDAFEHRLDAVCKEIGDRCKPMVAEAVPPEPTPDPNPTPADTRGLAQAQATTITRIDLTPAPAAVSRQDPSVVSISSLAPAPALAPARAPAPAPAPAPATPSWITAGTSERFTPAMHNVVPSPVQGQPNPGTVNASMSSSLTVFLEQQQRMQMIHEEKLEVQVREAKAEIIELRRELEKCRQENERLQADAVDSKVLAAATRANQVAALQERLEALNDAKLVEDEALCTIEDKVADAIATADTDYGAHNAWECVVQMINLSEGIASEKAFARQIVRKFA